VLIVAIFLDDYKNAKSLPLAPITVEILISRGSAYKIETNSGTIFPKMPNLSAPKIIEFWFSNSVLIRSIHGLSPQKKDNPFELSF
jgi:hypothetical protein